jgi:hypothetical protein
VLSVATFLVTLKEPSGSRSTSEIEAEHYFTDDAWVTFWTANGLKLPEPVARFERNSIAEIVKTSSA